MPEGVECVIKPIPRDAKRDDAEEIAVFKSVARGGLLNGENQWDKPHPSQKPQIGKVPAKEESGEREGDQKPGKKNQSHFFHGYFITLSDKNGNKQL